MNIETMFMCTVAMTTVPYLLISELIIRYRYYTDPVWNTLYSIVWVNLLHTALTFILCTVMAARGLPLLAYSFEHTTYILFFQIIFFLFLISDYFLPIKNFGGIIWGNRLSIFSPTYLAGYIITTTIFLIHQGVMGSTDILEDFTNTTLPRNIYKINFYLYLLLSIYLVKKLIKFFISGGTLSTVDPKLQFCLAFILKFIPYWLFIFEYTSINPYFAILVSLSGGLFLLIFFLLFSDLISEHFWESIIYNDEIDYSDQEDYIDAAPQVEPSSETNTELELQVPSIEALLQGQDIGEFEGAAELPEIQVFPEVLIASDIETVTDIVALTEVQTMPDAKVSRDVEAVPESKMALNTEILQEMKTIPINTAHEIDKGEVQVITEVETDVKASQVSPDVETIDYSDQEDYLDAAPQVEPSSETITALPLQVTSIEDLLEGQDTEEVEGAAEVAEIQIFPEVGIASDIEAITDIIPSIELQAVPDDVVTSDVEAAPKDQVALNIETLQEMETIPFNSAHVIGNTEVQVITEVVTDVKASQVSPEIETAPAMSTQVLPEIETVPEIDSAPGIEASAASGIVTISRIQARQDVEVALESKAACEVQKVQDIKATPESETVSHTTTETALQSTTEVSAVSDLEAFSEAHAVPAVQAIPEVKTVLEVEPFSEVQPALDTVPEIQTLPEVIHFSVVEGAPGTLYDAIYIQDEVTGAERTILETASVLENYFHGDQTIYARNFHAINQSIRLEFLPGTTPEDIYGPGAQTSSDITDTSEATGNTDVAGKQLKKKKKKNKSGKKNLLAAAAVPEDIVELECPEISDIGTRSDIEPSEETTAGLEAVSRPGTQTSSDITDNSEAAAGLDIAGKLIKRKKKKNRRGKKNLLKVPAILENTVESQRSEIETSEEPTAEQQAAPEPEAAVGAESAAEGDAAAELETASALQTLTGRKTATGVEEDNDTYKDTNKNVDKKNKSKLPEVVKDGKENKIKKQVDSTKEDPPCKDDAATNLSAKDPKDDKERKISKVRNANTRSSGSTPKKASEGSKDLNTSKKRSASPELAYEVNKTENTLQKEEEAKVKNQEAGTGAKGRDKHRESIEKTQSNNESKFNKKSDSGVKGSESIQQSTQQSNITEATKSSKTGAVKKGRNDSETSYDSSFEEGGSRKRKSKNQLTRSKGNKSDNKTSPQKSEREEVVFIPEDVTEIATLHEVKTALEDRARPKDEVEPEVAIGPDDKYIAKVAPDVVSKEDQIGTNISTHIKSKDIIEKAKEEIVEIKVKIEREPFKEGEPKKEDEISKELESAEESRIGNKKGANKKKGKMYNKTKNIEIKQDESVVTIAQGEEVKDSKQEIIAKQPRDSIFNEEVFKKKLEDRKETEVNKEDQACKDSESSKGEVYELGKGIENTSIEKERKNDEVKKGRKPKEDPDDSKENVGETSKEECEKIPHGGKETETNKLGQVYKDSELSKEKAADLEKEPNGSEEIAEKRIKAVEVSKGSNTKKELDVSKENTDETSFESSTAERESNTSLDESRLKERKSKKKQRRSKRNKSAKASEKVDSAIHSEILAPVEVKAKLDDKAISKEANKTEAETIVDVKGTSEVSARSEHVEIAAKPIAEFSSEVEDILCREIVSEIAFGPNPEVNLEVQNTSEIAAKGPVAPNVTTRPEDKTTSKVKEILEGTITSKAVDIEVDVTIVAGTASYVEDISDLQSEIADRSEVENSPEIANVSGGEAKSDFKTNFENKDTSEVAHEAKDQVEDKDNKLKKRHYLDDLVKDLVDDCIGNLYLPEEAKKILSDDVSEVAAISENKTRPKAEDDNQAEGINYITEILKDVNLDNSIETIDRMEKSNDVYQVIKARRERGINKDELALLKRSYDYNLVTLNDIKSESKPDKNCEETKSSKPEVKNEADTSREAEVDKRNEACKEQERDADPDISTETAGETSYESNVEKESETSFGSSGSNRKKPNERIRKHKRNKRRR